MEKDRFSWNDSKELKIPRGWGLIFYACLVHAGASYVSVNGRLHVYLKIKGGLPTFEGKFRPVVDISKLEDGNKKKVGKRNGFTAEDRQRKVEVMIGRLRSAVCGFNSVRVFREAQKKTLFEAGMHMLPH